MKSRVLVVDDDEAIVDGLTALLQLEDIEAAGACDRLSAQAMISGMFYPVIVADVRLQTEEQGLALLDDIRRVSPQSRVISLTGFSTPELERELRQRGSTALISKPASGAEMIDAVTALLAEVERLVDASESAALDQLHHNHPMTTARFATRVGDLRTKFVRTLPIRVAAIAQSLRERQDGLTAANGTLDRQFHNLAGTAGTFGLFAIAAAAIDGFDECADLAGAPIDGDARYLWSIVEELANEASGGEVSETSGVTAIPDVRLVLGQGRSLLS